MLPSPVDQAERLISLGVHTYADLSADELRATATTCPDGLLVTPAPASQLAPLLGRGDKPGFVVEDMTDVDAFLPTDASPVPPTSYVITGLDRGDVYANRTPDECLPEILAAGRSPLTLGEGIHWLLQAPEVLERNHCFMTIGSRLRRANGSYDARTPALWISNGTGRDGRERKDAPKVGWCWWGNRHTWLGMASCATRAPLG
ncbi:hypothetical protein SAMN05192575_11542 [Nocardioides alpinus]|uniref:Uncharacterized protein n=1 Tax=Nocardioides alpinus TaxID=748909 RepID=A0A1I1BED0_9ACTN|nr:DUF5701 family protein [Nocardioides alpinus]PKH40469.1 hypothetical protein CXG46_12610 [Nocardioides alpinus]SFB46870.1 hypothetical protein SAMN05192575_11542 [Nocardioides alpinus]